MRISRLIIRISGFLLRQADNSCSRISSLSVENYFLAETLSLRFIFRLFLTIYRIIIENILYKLALIVSNAHLHNEFPHPPYWKTLWMIRCQCHIMSYYVVRTYNRGNLVYIVWKFAQCCPETNIMSHQFPSLWFQLEWYLLQFTRAISYLF